MKRTFLSFLSFYTLFLLTGCVKSPEETLFTTYEEATLLEKEIPTYNQKLIELEGVESTLYTQIVSEGEESNANIQSVIESALQNCKDRKDLLDKESSAIEDSYNKSIESEDKIKKLEDDKAIEQGEKVQKLFKDRYDTFKSLEKNYRATIDAEEMLYNLLKAESQDLREIESRIGEINSLYETNRSTQETFTTLSTQLNTEKNVFYDLIGINVETSAT